MPSCCNPKWKGRKPRIHLFGRGNGIYDITVGSSMQFGFTTKREAMRVAKQEQSEQRVLKCGHIVRHKQEVVE